MRAELAYLESPLGYVPPSQPTQNEWFRGDAALPPTIKPGPIIIDRSAGTSDTLPSDD